MKLQERICVSLTALLLLVACAGTGTTATPAATPGSDITVSLEFPNVEVVDIYHVLGDMAGWNVIADPSVKGRFSISLKNEPLNRALDLVAGATGFGYVLVDNTLVIAPASRLSAFAKHDLAVLPVKSLAPQTAKVLMEAAAPGAVVTIDSAHGLALVTGTPEQVRQAADALSRYDVPAAKEFEFIDQPVADILLTLAKHAGKSVMIEGNLSARLTIYLRDMSLQDAIDLVAQRAGVQQEITGSGLLVFRPVSVAPTSESAVATTSESALVTDSQVVDLKYLPVSTARQMLNTLYPSLQVNTGAGDSFLMVKGPAADLQAAVAFLKHQDFPALRLVGIVQHGSKVMGVLEVAGQSYIVREGQIIGDLVVEALTADSVTVRHGERREVVKAGGLTSVSH